MSAIGWLVAATLVLAAALAACSSESRPKPPESAGPGWEGLENFPPDRTPDVLAWTGDELIVWGGSASGDGPHMVRTFDDGFAYEPSTGRWRTMASPELDSPMWNPASAWTGEELLVAGRQCGENVSAESAGPDECDGDLAIAAYDPTTDGWRAIDAGDASACFPSSLTWTGTVAVLSCGSHLWKFAPRRELEQIASPPSIPENTWQFCGGDDHLVAVMPVTNRRLADDRVPVLATTFDAGSWSEPVETGVEDRNAAQVGCMGSRVLAMSYAGGADAAVLEPRSRTWRPVPPAPEGSAVGATAWTGEEILYLDGGKPMAFNPNSDTWRELRSVPTGLGWVTASAGDRVVLWQYAPPQGVRLIAYNPNI